MAPVWPSDPGIDARVASAGGLKPDEASYTRLSSIVEAWAQGFHVGAIVLLILLLLCNYRKRILLHKLILLELILALWHGFFIFFDDPVYGWVLSGSAVPLYVSYNLHNVVSWLKIKPFLPRWGSLVFIISLMLVQPYWVAEAWANFEYFNSLGSDAFHTTRFLEPLMRDPWWIFTTVKLVLAIKQNYDYKLPNLIRSSPRFGVMLLCMLLSIVFLVTDVIVTARVSKQSGINPFWRFALVFKCASDTIFLDDFKSVLDHIAEAALKRIMSSNSNHGRRKSSVARPNGGASHHEHNAGTSVSISANRGDGDPRQAGKRGWVGLNSRRRDSLEQELMGEDSQGQIVAETTITISDQNQKRRGSQASASPKPYSNERPGNYGWDGPQATNTTQRSDLQANIPMVPLRAKTNVRPFS